MRDWRAQHSTVYCCRAGGRHDLVGANAGPQDKISLRLMHEDSVSAAETRRLRDRDAALRVLRDSLANSPTALPIVRGEPRTKSQQNIPIRKDAPVVEP